jgi:hypothetical protein
MTQNLTAFWTHTKGSMRDLAPIVFVIAFFEFVVLQQIPDGLFGILLGVGFVVIGLTFFIYGLELALFPIGDALAVALAKKGSVALLLIFAFLLGFGTTIGLSAPRWCWACCASFSAGRCR